LHRTIGAGLAYNTSQGFGARGFWENRNLFCNAEYLRLSADVGQQIEAFRANFRRPDSTALRRPISATPSERYRKFADSPLEGGGFEPSVPVRG
jgi:outer membrane protein assembly factor BamA